MQPAIVTTSWDDGYKPDLRIVQLLQTYKLKGTFYITPFLGDLTDLEIKKIDKSQEIGAHSLTHPRLTKISLVEAKKEIKGSKEYLENILGHSIKMFCYPRGEYNEQIKKLVKESGFLGQEQLKDSL